MDTAAPGPEEEGGKAEEKKKEGEAEDKTDGGDAEEAAPEMDDATEVAAFTPYHWKEWSVVRSQDCLYLWNDFASLELSNVSNGWFRFLVDNKLATMYSSGSTEGGPDSFGELWSTVAAALFVVVHGVLLCRVFNVYQMREPQV